MNKKKLLYYFSHPRTITILALIAVLLIALIIAQERPASAEENGAEPTEAPRGRNVTLVQVGTVSQTERTVEAFGEVRSNTEADIRTQTSGTITNVPIQLGQFVERGQIILEVENSSEHARVLQAEAALQGANASLQSVQRGARAEHIEILQENVAAARQSLQNAERSAENILRTAENAIDHTIRNTADQLFLDPETHSPQFIVPTTDSQRANTLASQRVRLQEILARNDQPVGTTDLGSELSVMQNDLTEIHSFLNTTMSVLQTAIPTEQFPQEAIQTSKASIEQARGHISSVNAQVLGAADAVSGARTRLSIAETELRDAQIGPESEDIAVARASVLQAEGAVRAARSDLERTILRAPVSGEVIALAIDQGDTVSMQEFVATIANIREPKIIAFITERERADIQQGASVLINRNIPGRVTNIAPALDRATRKVEVEIQVEEASNLLHGQSVRVSISTADRARESTDPFIIPLSAIKIESDRNVVFTVTEDHRAVANEVTLGALLGERVMVLEGLTPDMWIILDARGIREGDPVTPN